MNRTICFIIRREQINKTLTGNHDDSLNDRLKLYLTQVADELIFNSKVTGTKKAIQDLMTALEENEISPKIALDAARKLTGWLNG